MGESMWSGVAEREEGGLNTWTMGDPSSGEPAHSEGLVEGVFGLTEFWMMVILCFGEVPLGGMTAVLV